MAFTGKPLSIDHHLILLDLNGWSFEHSVSSLPICFSAECNKTFSGPG